MFVPVDTTHIIIHAVSSLRQRPYGRHAHSLPWSHLYRSRSTENSLDSLGGLIVSPSVHGSLHPNPRNLLHAPVTLLRGTVNIANA